MAGRRKAAAPLAEQVQRRVRELRTARGLTQEELCERAGISIDAVTRIEGGRRTPTLDTLERIAAALQISPAAFLEVSEQRTRNPSTTAQRVAALIDAEPAEVQRQIERIVRAVVVLARRSSE